MVTYREATFEDVSYLADNLRQADLDEIEALGVTHSTHETIATALIISDECLVAVQDDKPIAIFGVATSSDGDTGIPWLLATEELESVPLEVVKKSKAWVEEKAEQYGDLVNFVSVENRKAIRWLNSLGFTFGNTFKSSTGAYFIGFGRTVNV